MNTFVGPYTCPVCDKVFITTLELAAHNEDTGHLNRTPTLKRIPKHAPLKAPVPKIQIHKILRVKVDLGDGFFVFKEVAI